MLTLRALWELLRRGRPPLGVAGPKEGRQPGPSIEFEVFREAAPEEDVREVDWISSLTLERPVARVGREPRGSGVLWWSLGIDQKEGTGDVSKEELTSGVLWELAASLRALPQIVPLAVVLPAKGYWRSYPPAHPSSALRRLGKGKPLIPASLWERPGASLVLRRVTSWLPALSLVILVGDWSSWRELWQEVVLIWGFLERHRLAQLWFWVADQWELEVPSPRVTLRAGHRARPLWVPLGEGLFRTRLKEVVTQERKAMDQSMASLGLRAGRDWTFLRTSCSAKVNLEEFLIGPCRSG
jgi:hypothetical protein